MNREPRDEQQQRFEGIASTLLLNPSDLAEVSGAIANVMSQAIADGVVKARHGLGSDLVSWDLADLSGQLGGFTQVCEVKAVIYAKAGSP